MGKKAPGPAAPSGDPQAEAGNTGAVVALQSALDKEHPDVFTDPTDPPRGAA